MHNYWQLLARYKLCDSLELYAWTLSVIKTSLNPKSLTVTSYFVMHAKTDPYTYILHLAISMKIKTDRYTYGNDTRIYLLNTTSNIGV